MKFDYCIGNPPYQESKNGTNNTQLWPDFVNETTSIADKSCFIHPGRWVIPKKTMIKTRDSILKDGLEKFKLYTDTNYIFPTLRGIDSGITITYFNKAFKGLPTYSVNGKRERVYDVTKKIFLNAFEEEAFSKCFENIDTSLNMLNRVLGNVGSLGSCEFGYNKWEHLSFVKDSPDDMKEPIHVYSNDSLKRKTGKYIWGYIEKDKLNSYPEELFSSRKVLISKIASNEKDTVNGFNKLPQICDVYATTEKHVFILPEKDTDRDLDLIYSLMMTKTARFLMSLTCKGLCTMGFENVPDYIELAKLLPEDRLFTDEWFYKTFDFSEGLINEIETRVSPKVDKEA